jgi:hypothetical protein
VMIAPSWYIVSAGSAAIKHHVKLKRRNRLRANMQTSVKSNTANVGVAVSHDFVIARRGKSMTRYLIAALLLATQLHAQETAPALLPHEVVPAAATTQYNPGDGLTVSMLNGQSKLKLFGQFSALGIFSTTRPFAAGLPLLLLPPSLLGLNTNTFDLHARQTNFGAVFTGPDVMGFTPSATFLGFVQNDNLTSDGYGLLPFNAYGELKNDDWRIAAGLMNDVFNPGKPTVITLGSLFGSGNTGSFRGQARLEHYFKPSDAFQLTSQFAISEPVSTIVTGNQRILEDWPNIEARLASGLGEIAELAGGRKQRIAELGVSGFVGQLRSSAALPTLNNPVIPNRAVIDTWGLGVDGQWAFTERFGVSGEIFIGKGMGEYNGGIQQTFNSTTFQPIHARGGFGEIYGYLTDALHLHVGYGIDAPRRRDLTPTMFAKNQSYYANMVWDASKVLQISFEVDYRKTDYIAFRNADGVIFFTQMALRF